MSSTQTDLQSYILQGNLRQSSCYLVWTNATTEKEIQETRTKIAGTQ